MTETVDRPTTDRHAPCPACGSTWAPVQLDGLCFICACPTAERQRHRAKYRRRVFQLTDHPPAGLQRGSYGGLWRGARKGKRSSDNGNGADAW